MHSMFDRFDVWFNDEKGVDKPFMFAVKDKDEIKNGFECERWLYAWMNLEEAKKIHNFLGEHIRSCKKGES